MLKLCKLFYRLFASEFYRANAGFFLLLICICFGVLTDKEHTALGQYFISSRFLIFIPIAAWLSYCIKAIQFNGGVLKKPSYSFIFSAIGLEKPTHWMLLYFISFIQFLPIMAYGFFLILLMARSHLFTTLGWVVSALILFPLVISLGLYQAIHRPQLEKKISFLKRTLDRTFTRNYAILFFEWLLRSQPTLVIGTKLFSMAVLYGICKLYVFDDYDHRLLAMGVAIVSATNAPLVFSLQRLENFHFSWTRSLPIHTAVRFLTASLVLFCLSVPEYVLIGNYFPTELPRVVWPILVFWGISFLALAYSILYQQDLSLESYMRKIFVIWIVSVLVLLFGLPPFALASLYFMLAYYFIHRFYYQFEFRTEVDSYK